MLIEEITTAIFDKLQEYNRFNGTQSVELKKEYNKALTHIIKANPEKTFTFFIDGTYDIEITNYEESFNFTLFEYNKAVTWGTGQKDTKQIFNTCNDYITKKGAN